MNNVDLNTLQIHDEFPPENETPIDQEDTLHFPILMFMIMMYALCMIVAVKIYRYQPKLPPIDKVIGEKLQGIKGWLFILGIYVLCMSLKEALDSWEDVKLILYNNNWTAISSLNTEFQPWLGSIFLAACIKDIAFLIGFLLVFCLYVMKKSLFPKAFLFLILSSFLFVVLDIGFGVFVFTYMPTIIDII